MRKQDRPYQGSLASKVDLLLGGISKPESPVFLPIDSLSLPKFQPRQYFDKDKLVDLTKAIEAHGILEPLLVRKIAEDAFELVAGGRRYRAAQLVGLEKIPVVVLSLTDEEALEVAILENLQREDLSPLEETEGILRLLETRLKLERKEVVSLLYRMRNQVMVTSRRNVSPNESAQIVESIFSQVGISPKSFVETRLPLLKLPIELLEALRSGQIAYTKAKAIATLKDEAARAEILDMAIANSLSLNQIKERVNAAKPTKEKEGLKSRVDNTYKQLKKSKQLWQDPKKRKKLESLLSQLEKLIESESSSIAQTSERPIVKTPNSKPESLEQIEEESATEAEKQGLNDQELGKLLGVSNLILRDCRVKGKKSPAGLAKKLQNWEVKGDRWVRKS
jgi:ParB family chromosome partitioning protein